MDKLRRDADKRIPLPSFRGRPGVGRMLLFFFIGLALIISIGVLAIYSPLGIGSESGLFPATLKSNRDVDNRVTVVVYEHGVPMTVRFSVHNGGAWGVTITSVPERDFGLFRVTSVRMGFADPARCCIETQPFHSFALRPGEDRLIELHGRMEGCADYAAGSSTEWSSYDVRFRVAGIPKAASIAAADTIRIEVPAGYVCPEPARNSSN